MKKRILIPLAVLGLLAWLSACSSAPKPIELFNGKNLDGWIGYLEDKSLDPAREFVVKDGVIHLSGKLGYLYTEKTYSDYKLEVEWRWPDTLSNSGIFLHMTPEDKALPPMFECQLKAGDAGALYGFSGPLTQEMRDAGHYGMPRLLPSNEKPVGQWNKAEITCEGDNITIYINGELQNRATGASVSSGYVALQSEGLDVEFRNVVLTPLK